MMHEAKPSAAAADADFHRAVAAFLDFDGTLVALAPRPDEVIVPKALAASLAALAARLDGALALVTGRPIEAVDRFLAPYRFAVAGGHGTERRRADGTMIAPDPALAAAAARIGARLRPLVEREPRLVLETKPASVGLHFREAPELEAVCRTAVDAALTAEPLFTVVAGKMVFEARPARIDKGTAVEVFLTESPFAGRAPLFIGDDRTDEDGFASVQARGGLGIKVGPGQTAAHYRLADPAAVHRLVGRLGDGGTFGDMAALRAFLDQQEAAS
jgi:trehalose 6-phosphate phosphatase